MIAPRVIISAFGLIGFLAVAHAPSAMAQATSPELQEVVLDDLPSSVTASMEVRDRWFTSTAAFSAPEAFLVDDLLRWLPGQTLRVAFLGGDVALHRDIEEATRQITAAANIKFDFGFDPSTGRYRSWSPSDTTYAAEVRVSFDLPGYFSLVGTDSVSSVIGEPSEPVGGRPGQRSLNLGGFHIQRPASWAGTVRHEFLHALAFHHEHQSRSGGCDNEFRWQDDPGYQPSRDLRGTYVPDLQNRRPGIYTYLAGFPNRWDQAKVDHNLRQISSPGLTAGPFDRSSVMLYRFPSLFYKTQPNSPCAPTGDGQNLSDGDRLGLQQLYPSVQALAQGLSERRKNAYRSLLNSVNLSDSIRNGLALQVDILKFKGKV